VLADEEFARRGAAVALDEAQALKEQQAEAKVQALEAKVQALGSEAKLQAEALEAKVQAEAKSEHLHELAQMAISDESQRKADEPRTTTDLAQAAAPLSAAQMPTSPTSASPADEADEMAQMKIDEMKRRKASEEAKHEAETGIGWEGREKDEAQKAEAEATKEKGEMCEGAMCQDEDVDVKDDAGRLVA